MIWFETEADEKEIRSRGAEKFSRGKVKKRALDLGRRYQSLIEMEFIAPTFSQWIDTTIGYGLFAAEALKKGSYVGEYGGVVRRNDRRYFEPENHYCYEYPVEDEIGRHFVIDASEGGATRLINHSATPNLLPLYAFYDNLYHLIFLAKKTIRPGEQLSYDYGPSYWYTREPPTIF